MQTQTRRLVIVLAALLAALSAVSANTANTAAAQPPAPGWIVECVECARSFPDLSPRSAALEPDGTLHVVYGRDGLYHLTLRGGAQVIETVAEGRNLRPPVMTLDSNGRVHALFADDAGGLRYARQTAGGWQIDSLPLFTGPNAAVYALAVGPDGVVHVTVYDSARGQLVYARSQANGWLTTVLDSEPLAGAAHALTLDPDGRPALCYKVQNGILRIARLAATGWQFEELPPPADGYSCDLAFDPDGALHVAHRDAERLAYSTRTAAGWTTETILDGELATVEHGHAISLRLDAGGAPHVAFDTYYLSPLPHPAVLRSQRYATRGLSGWRVATVDDENGRDGTLVLDGDDPFIVYRAAQALALAERAGDEWQSVALDPARDAGYDSSVAVHGFEMRATYFDAENRAVRYATRGPAGWSAETVSSGPAGGALHTSSELALGPGGETHVLYVGPYDPVSFSTLAYAFKIGPVWNYQEVPQSVGAPFALAADRTFRVHLALRHISGGLAYLRWPPGWLDPTPYEMIDDAIPDRERLAIAVDGAGIVHVGYADDEGVRYATRAADGAWTSELVYDGPGAEAADYVSLALGPDGRPHLAFYAGGLRYATRAAPGAPWQVDSRLAFPDSGRFASIAVDALGRVHLAYYEGSQADLYYERLDAAGGNWQRTVVVAEGQVGMDCDLALDPFGNPVITYRDADRGDMLVAYLPANVRATAFLPAISR